MSSKWFHGKNEYNDAADSECLKIYYLPDAKCTKNWHNKFGKKSTFFIPSTNIRLVSPISIMRSILIVDFLENLPNTDKSAII